MLYNLFCDAEWKEPIRLATKVAIQIGQTVYLAKKENDGNHYRVAAIEQTAFADQPWLERPQSFEARGVIDVTVVRISDAELDQGTQTGCATT